jgi:hypothetical protein
MTERERELRELAATVSERESVVDAWTAKSFTDRLFVLEMATGVGVPDELRARLHDHGLRGYNEVHEVDAETAAYAGQLDHGGRYQFVDVRARGELQSYVVD